MSKKKKNKKLTHDEASVKIAKYAMIGAFSYPTCEAIKVAGKIILALIRHK